MLNAHAIPEGEIGKQNAFKKVSAHAVDILNDHQGTSRKFELEALPAESIERKEMDWANTMCKAYMSTYGVGKFFQDVDMLMIEKYRTIIIKIIAEDDQMLRGFLGHGLATEKFFSSERTIFNFLEALTKDIETRKKILAFLRERLESNPEAFKNQEFDFVYQKLRFETAVDTAVQKMQDPSVLVNEIITMPELPAEPRSVLLKAIFRNDNFLPVLRMYFMNHIVTPTGELDPAGVQLFAELITQSQFKTFFDEMYRLASQEGQEWCNQSPYLEYMQDIQAQIDSMFAQPE